jgi:hypothetical protein
LRAGEGIGASGVGGIAAGEGLVRLDGGSLTAGFFLLSKGGLAVKSATMKKEIIKGCSYVNYAPAFSGAIVRSVAKLASITF